MSSSSVRAAHLLIKHTGSRNPVSRRTNKTITTPPEMAYQELQQYEQSILQQVNNEGVDLASIFRQYASDRSDCSSYQHGGDLGEFTRGQMQQPFEEAAFALRPGQMSTIVSTDSGYHLIYRIS
jgi:parvulin-like peptidyl-prolyl isomerase